uniref:Uncharacterized protein n=1 Tax=Arundo donax TaxID=35708 RepID=A0A0A9C3S6_ARUDO
MCHSFRISACLVR